GLGKAALVVPVLCAAPVLAVQEAVLETPLPQTSPSSLKKAPSSRSALQCQTSPATLGTPAVAMPSCLAPQGSLSRGVMSCSDELPTPPSLQPDPAYWNTLNAPPRLTRSCHCQHQMLAGTRQVNWSPLS
ncbi:hypothetical protein CIB84_011300, partial [Bambusicola thoracicus]